MSMISYLKQRIFWGTIAILLMLNPCVANELNSGTIQLEAEDYTEQSGIKAENCQEGGQNIGYIEEGDYIKFSSIDFGSGQNYFQVRAASNTSGGKVQLFLNSLTNTEHASITVSNTSGWQSWQTFTTTMDEVTGVHDVYIRFSGENGYLLNVNWLSFDQTPANNSVELLFPDENEKLTDIACAFKAKITTNGPYLLYLSKSQDFSGEIITHQPVTQNGKSKDDRNMVYFLTLQGKLKPSQKFVLPPGDWYWRISGDGGESFSEIRKLTVNNAHTVTAPKLVATPDLPIFHMRLRGNIFDYPNPIERLKRIVPDELKANVVLDIGTSFSFIPNGRSLYDYCKLFNDAGYQFYFDLGAHSVIGRIASLGEMEKVFRELPYCVGAATGEMNYYYPYTEEDNSLIYGTLQLCQKYGRHFLLADMNWNWAKWQLFSYRFYDLFTKNNYGPYFYPQFKTTDPWGSFTCVSALQGMLLSGMADNIGIWSDMWCWEKFGQVNTIELTDWMEGKHNPDGGQNAFPFIQNMKAYIWGITFGSTTFGLEPTLWAHWQTSEPNDLHSRYLIPFIEAIVSEKIIPSKESINNNFNVVVNTEFTSSNFGSSPRLSFVEGNVWGDFLRNTYGIADIPPYNEVYASKQGDIIQAAYLEMIPNTDRYPSGIPFLVKPSAKVPIVNNRQLSKVNISKLRTQANVNELLNKYYPESENEAFAVKIDSSIFVFNTFENHDIKQSYKLGIHHAGIDSMMGNIPLLNYIIGRIRPDGKSLFIQTNAQIRNDNLKGAKYKLPNYNSVLNFKCQTKPDIESAELYAIKSSWDKASQIFTVHINHKDAGAVNFVLVGDPNITYSVEAISLMEKSIVIRPGEHQQLSATLLPTTIKGISPTWRSLNANIASISRTGKVMGIQEGEVQIVAEIKGLSDTLTCKVINSVANQSNQMQEMYVYPNPVTDRLYISGAPNGTSMELLDLSGRTLLNTIKNPIPIHQFPSGTYLLKLKNGEKARIVKVLIE